MTKQDKAADKRLYKTYGITLADYNKMLENQGGKCYICGSEAKLGRRLHVDHCHKTARTKIHVCKTDGLEGSDIANMSETPWYAIADDCKSYGWGKTRKEAKENAKRKLLKSSIRGLLDWKCNSALQKFRDNPDWMERAAQYIRKFQKGLNGATGITE